MIKDINYYRAVNNATGCSSKKEMQSNQIKRRLERSFQNPLDVDTFINYFTKEKINLEINKQSFSEDMGYQKKFKSLITAPVTNGDTFYNDKENTYWICTEAETKDYLYYSGTLTKCNWILKWQNNNGIIVERPSIILSTSQYGSGENKNKILTLGYNQLIAYVILDDETLKLKSDKRMFVDNNMNFPKPYRITKADTVTKSYMGIGIMTLIFSEDQYNSVTDNIELMICDYIPNKTITPLKIEYSGLPEVRNGGSVKMFTANTNKKVIWNINATNLQKKYIKIIETDNQIKIKCLYNELLVGTNFVLECVCNNVKTPLTITITGGV